MNVFPVRTKADRGIRNVRFTDIRAAYQADGRDACFWTVVSSLPGKSYIFVLNIVTYTYFVYEDWFQILTETGIFQLEEYALRDFLKNLSDDCKKKDFVEDRRFLSLFIENHNLFGALQPPVEGWDPMEQTAKLAANEVEPHGLVGSEKYYGDEFFRRLSRVSLHLELAVTTSNRDTGS